VAASKREIEEIYRKRYPAFRRTLATVTGSYEAAHDVVQEAFARALASRRQYRGEAPLAAWVWQIAFRVALDERARSMRVLLEEKLELELVEPAHDPELADALRRLPARRRLVFFLRYFADLTYEEIATVCGISEGTVAASLAQARAELAEALRSEISP
jgi:RNA polymerase sigma-70 factor (ECF subfamily)